jgi:hypothetical protein
MQLTPTATQPAPEGDRERSVTVVGPFNREIDLILRHVCHLRAFHLYLIHIIHYRLYNYTNCLSILFTN